MKKLTSKHGSEVRKPAALRVIFLFHTISPELSFVSINNPFPEFEFIFRWSVVLTMFCELLWQQISVNQRSVDNAHLEIVELCPASHRPLLTKVVHVWLDWAPSLKAWVRRSSSPLYNGQPLYSIRPKSSQDFMNGTITGQSTTANHQTTNHRMREHIGAVLVCVLFVAMCSDRRAAHQSLQSVLYSCRNVGVAS